MLVSVVMTLEDLGIIETNVIMRWYVMEITACDAEMSLQMMFF